MPGRCCCGKWIGLIDRVAACFKDRRRPDAVVHGLRTLVGQRIVGIACGYEDVNDHDQLRFDPVLSLFSGGLEAKRKGCAALAGKSTVNRLEHAPRRDDDRYHKIRHDAQALETVFVDVFLDAHAEPPKEIVLDLDATDDPLHGHQEGRFFHGYYDCYCYLPLYVFCGPHLLTAKLRPANIDAAAGATEEVARLAGRIRARWPRVRIVLRADSGFAREALMAWCERNRVDYVLGLARNSRLLEELAIDLAWDEDEHQRTGKPVRRYKDFRYRTRNSWSRRRRVVGKAEHLAKGANPRFVVTSLKRRDIDARTLYERIYCARGEMENKIKECQLDLLGLRPASRSRPHLHGHHEGKPAPAVVLLLRLRSDRGPAADRPRPYRTGQRHLRHDPPRALKDRGAGHRLGPADQDCHCLGVPLPG